MKEGNKMVYYNFETNTLEVGELVKSTGINLKLKLLKLIYLIMLTLLAIYVTIIL